MHGILEKAGRFEIQEYKPPSDYQRLRQTHLPYSGSPRKHPHDPDKVILIPDPFIPHAHYFQFRMEDVSYVEKLPNLVALDGDNVPMVRVWVKKMSVAVMCYPFLVADIGE